MYKKVFVIFYIYYSMCTTTTNHNYHADITNKNQAVTLSGTDKIQNTASAIN